MATSVGTRWRQVGRQRCGAHPHGACAAALLAAPLLAGVLLAGTLIPADVGEAVARGLMCRGGGGMTVNAVDRGGALIRLTREIAPSMRSWLAPGECQWFESQRSWRPQPRYDALYYCCYAHVDRLSLLVESGHPFRLWVYPDDTFSSVLVIDSVGE